MTKHLLRIRAVDRKFFEIIKTGQKTIETRAGTNKFQMIRTGDILKFVCGKESLERKVTKVSHFKTIEEMLRILGLAKIMPFAKSVDEAKKVYYSFPQYKEKIEKYGLVAFEMENL
jgi:ASC-1-like (ASCH) protein